MVRVIHACCVLHNLANIEDLQLFEAALDDQEPDIDAQNRCIPNNEAPREYETGVHKRDEICHQITMN